MAVVAEVVLETDVFASAIAGAIAIQKTGLGHGPIRFVALIPTQLHAGGRQIGTAAAFCLATIDQHYMSDLTSPPRSAFDTASHSPSCNNDHTLPRTTTR